jgi:hypothetical protein
LLDEGNEAAEDDLEVDNEDLAGFGDEHKGSVLILFMIPLPLRGL